MQNLNPKKKSYEKIKKSKKKSKDQGRTSWAIRNHLILQSSSIADAQQHCVAVIKQEVHDNDDENNVENVNSNRSTPTDVAHESTGLSSAALLRQSKHFRQQQEEIVNRLHKAVSDNLKLINQGTESACNGSGFTVNKQQQDDQSCANHNLNLNMNLSANSRFAVRNFNGSTSDIKMCRLNKSKLSNTISGAQQQQQHQQHHQQQQQLHANDLFSSLMDNDDNNNSSDLLNDDSSNVDGNYLLPCPLCEIPLEPRVFRQHLDRHYPRDSPICPVLQCGRRFAHPNSVRNHMRLKHTIQWNRMKSMRSSGGPFSSLPY
jgi:hypothetical protein